MFFGQQKNSYWMLTELHYQFTLPQQRTNSEKHAIHDTSMDIYRNRIPRLWFLLKSNGCWSWYGKFQILALRNRSSHSSWWLNTMSERKHSVDNPYPYTFTCSFSWTVCRVQILDAQLDLQPSLKSGWHCVLAVVLICS